MIRMLPLMGLILVCIGCRSTHPFHQGILVRNHLSTHEVEALPLEFTAEYVLYSRPALDQEGVEVLSRELSRADELGFEARPEGQLFAVAGEEHVALEPGLYCWHIRPGTGPSALAFKVRSLTGVALGVFALSLVSLGSLFVL